MTSIDLPNVIDSDNLNKTPLINGGTNPLLYTAQDNDVGVVFHYAANHNIIKQYINVDYRIISIKIDNSLIDKASMYVPIQ